jgi:formylmethanofuran--tetrahydromethanopterin N-formyltransferase
MRSIILRGIRIDDSFAEAFDMRATALIVTAPTLHWARQAATTMTGFGTSVIGCGCEAGIDGELKASETPDGRPGVRVLIFAVSSGELRKQVQNRVGQCVLTSPGSACYAGLAARGETLPLGNALRYFGDGWQISKRFGDKHYWRVPVMDGEFVCEATTGLTKTAVGGGNLLIMGGSGCSRSGGRCDAQDCRCHSAVPWRDRSFRFEDRVEIQGTAGFDERRLLPDPEGGGYHRARIRHQFCA